MGRFPGYPWHDQWKPCRWICQIPASACDQIFSMAGCDRFRIQAPGSVHHTELRLRLDRPFHRLSAGGQPVRSCQMHDRCRMWHLSSFPVTSYRRGDHLLRQHLAQLKERQLSCFRDTGSGKYRMASISGAAQASGLQPHCKRLQQCHVLALALNPQCDWELLEGHPVTRFFRKWDLPGSCIHRRRLEADRHPP